MDICFMDPDEKDEDPSRKETQIFDPALIDEDGIHSEPLRDPEHESAEQEQRGKDADQESEGNGGWQTFKTP
jgi:hypothetical protein